MRRRKLPTSRSFDRGSAPDARGSDARVGEAKSRRSSGLTVAEVGPTVRACETPYSVRASRRRWSAAGRARAAGPEARAARPGRTAPAGRTAPLLRLHERHWVHGADHHQRQRPSYQVTHFIFSGEASGSGVSVDQTGSNVVIHLLTDATANICRDNDYMATGTVGAGGTSMSVMLSGPPCGSSDSVYVIVTLTKRDRALPGFFGPVNPREQPLRSDFDCPGFDHIIVNDEHHTERLLPRPPSLLPQPDGARRLPLPPHGTPIAGIPVIDSLHHRYGFVVAARAPPSVDHASTDIGLSFCGPQVCARAAADRPWLVSEAQS
jgi:hypothetical protein